MKNLDDRLRELKKETGRPQKEFGKIFSLSESAIGLFLLFLLLASFSLRIQS